MTDPLFTHHLGDGRIPSLAGNDPSQLPYPDLKDGVA